MAGGTDGLEVGFDDDNSIQCLQKLMEISTVKHAAETAGRIYVSVKGNNRLFTFYFLTVEKGVELVTHGFIEPVAKRFQKPIKIVDNYACFALDEAQEKLPLMISTPGNILRNGCMSVMQTGLAQMMISVVEKLLYTAEMSVTLLPEISVVDVDTDENDKHLVDSVIGNFKKLYGVATTPLHVTGRFLHASRRTVHKLKKSTDIKTDSNEPSESKYRRRGLLGRLLRLPVTGFQYIGMLSEQRAILNKQRDPATRVNPETCNQQLDEVERQWEVFEQDDADRSSSDSEEDEELNFSTPLSPTSRSTTTSPASSQTPTITVSSPEANQVASD